MFRKVLTLSVAMLLGCQGVSFAAATQVDSLIEKLVQKGILDKKEARELKMEIAEDAKIINSDAAKAEVPDWVKNTKIKGDVRVRYQYERKRFETDSATLQDEAQMRGRVRVRLGVENQINNQWKTGIGLSSANHSASSSGDDARSTNATFGDAFRRGDIRLDYGFIEYQPAPWGKVIAGKFVKSDYLWVPTDMLWDSDLNPNGASTHLEYKLSDQFNFSLNNGLWILDDNAKLDKVDPLLYYAQPSIKFKEVGFDVTLAGTYYGFSGVKGSILDGGSLSNTTISGTSGTALKYDYDAIGASGEIGFNNPTNGLLPIPRFSIFGDYIQNMTQAVSDNETGWAAGAKIGDEKVGGPKQWQLKYQYTNLGTDAFPDVFPDSDRYGGVTDVRGHEWELTLGLTKNVSLGFDYYQDQRINGAHNLQRVAQADLNVKF